MDGRIRLKIMLKELVVSMLTGSHGSGSCLLANYVTDWCNICSWSAVNVLIS